MQEVYENNQLNTDQRYKQNNLQLPCIPHIVIKKNTPTNIFISQKNAWYISMGSVPKQIKKSLQKCDQLADNTHTKQISFQMSLYYELRIILQLNKVVKDHTLQVYALHNLIYACKLLNAVSLEELFTKRLFIMFVKQLNSNQFKIPKNYHLEHIMLRQCQKIPDSVTSFHQICYTRSIIHLRLAKIQLFHALEESRMKENRIKLQSGYRNLLKAMGEMMIVMLSLYVKKQLIRKKIGENQQKQTITFGKIINFLYRTGFQEFSTQTNLQLIILKDLIAKKIAQNIDILQVPLNCQISQFQEISIQHQNIKSAIKYSYSKYQDFKQQKYEKIQNCRIEQFILTWVSCFYLKYLLLNIQQTNYNKQSPSLTKNNQNLQHKISLRQNQLSKVFEITHHFMNKSQFNAIIRNEYLTKYWRRQDNNNDNSSYIEKFSDSLLDVVEKIDDKQKLGLSQGSQKVWECSNYQIIILEGYGKEQSCCIRRLKAQRPRKLEQNLIGQQKNISDVKLKRNRYNFETSKERNMSRGRSIKSSDRNSSLRSNTSRTIDQIRATYNSSQQKTRKNQLKLSNLLKQQRKQTDSSTKSIKKNSQQLQMITKMKNRSFQFNNLHAFIQDLTKSNKMNVNEIKQIQSFKEVMAIDNKEAIKSRKNPWEENRRSRIRSNFMPGGL